MHSADDLVMCLGDFNGQIGRYFDGGYVIDQKNLEGRMLLVV